MLLRLFTSVVPIWWKYYILVCYCISSQHCVQFCHIGSMKLATIGVFPPWKSANTTKQGLIHCAADCLNLSFLGFFWPCRKVLWDLSSPTRDRTQAPGSETSES